jgi:hypothetical protein
VRIKSLRENPLAKIAVNSFRLVSLLMENSEAIKHETGKIFTKKLGNSKSNEVKMCLNSPASCKREFKIWPSESTISSTKTDPRKKRSHSLRMSILI